MKVKACYISATGKVRARNEDSILLNDLLVSEGEMELVGRLDSGEERQIYVVADGMGGHRKGEIASKTVLSVFRKNYRDIGNAAGLRETLRHAKEELDKVVEKERASYGLGTTVTGLVLAGSRGIVFNCGDSRTYRRREGRTERITKDHSLVQRLFEDGIISEEEMRTDPRKNIITSAVIGDLSGEPPEAEIQEVRIGAGERFLLCSDGVWESMNGDELGACFSMSKLEEGAECLLGKTLARGARDNLSIIALEIGGRESDPGR
ncbi:MAG: protein phosphatase 2C domain-containing protein [Nitrospirae bacterium]|nr:protein phosphatase 2C domain-containing protein [Nitrospirota bacterium]